MSIDLLANYADIISGVAVIVSLIYVGVQVRRNTRSTRSQTNQLAHESLASVSMEVAKSPQLTELTSKAMSDFDQLTTLEKYQYDMIMLTLFRRYENVYYQFCEGLLEKDLWQGYVGSILFYYHTDGGRAFWQNRRNLFAPKFRAWLESTSLEELQVPERA